MLIEATCDPEGDEPRLAAWHVAVRELIAVAAWVPKRPGLGEDAEPTFMHHAPSGRGVLGVYDGLGGAGARHAGRAADGRRLSHAFVASRLAHLTVQSWFADLAAGQAEPTLPQRLAETLGGARTAARNKIVGTMRRDFPTTLAVIDYQQAGDGLTVAASWAGDSRCYLLTADLGLQQLSKDDSDVEDVLELLIADQPMTNVVSASGDSTIHRRVFAGLPTPCVLVCATDGFFGYVTAPAMFEHVLLSELDRAADAGEWAQRLTARVRGYTSDDASVVAVAVGFGSFAQLQEEYRERLRRLTHEHADMFDTVAGRTEFVAARRRSWEIYRRNYLRYFNWPTEDLTVPRSPAPEQTGARW
ncbi:PP2C family protein-serine/threonine phosphatase [Catellatospora bangladeshensis]|uniref:PPM-type phosphatase domain-containing protein n=2 Tax=Catellatospora bangladeshensis TaxID=310355 RepID=A0A8J3JNS2_9ACTN|nr:hypothetical protein [Catellatospora bangladeshensis]GIF85829.1 hypothetical protein Cba03nite_71780 [Catellatospora bangladeshensis]